MNRTGRAPGRATPPIALRRRRENPERARKAIGRGARVLIYLVALGILDLVLALAAAPGQLRPRVADLPVLLVFGLVAALTRQQRFWVWRVEAGAITPAFVFASLLLAGPGIAAGTIAVAYALEIARGDGRRPSPLTAAAVQLAAVMTATMVLGRVAPAWPERVAGAEPALIAALAYWLTWQVLALPMPLLSGNPVSRISLGMREEAARGLLLLFAGITLAVLWSSGTLAFACGLITMTFLNRAVSSSHFGREALLEPKTGLFNASYFQEVAELELQRCRRLDRPASVLMADLDHLREINNKYGHQTGDLVIRRVAEVIKSGTRLFDVPARFGGEEFAILLPETSKRRARVIAERLRQMLAAEEFRAARLAVSGAGEAFHVTMSVGVATFPEDATKADILLARADQAAYAAKAGGRNQVKVFNPPPDLELLLAKDS